MKISLTLISIGQFLLQAVSAYDSVEERPTVRALATCPAGGLLDTTGKYCCASSCGQCGGSGCDKRPGGSSACCTSQITKSCGANGFPCIASTGSSSNKCPTGSILDASGKTCCSAACGQCGGSGCHLRPGGAAACCTSKVSASCSAGKLPCLLSGSSTPPPTNPSGFKCPTGSIADSTGKICCPSSCGQCGGSGCHLRPGGTAACCTSQVTKSCTGNKPPCLLTGTETPPPPTNKCPTGGILDASGKICCTGSCGTCGGSGCDSRIGGSANCCTSKITAPCSTGKLPCVLGGNNITPTPTPTPKPTPKPSEYCKDGTLSDIIYAYPNCSMQVCCPKSCSTCRLYSCEDGPECCIDDIYNAAQVNDIDVSCRTRGPPCIVPPANDPCTPNSCKRGAECGVGFQYDASDLTQAAICVSTTICKCKDVGNFYGQNCEFECGKGETPCGGSNYDYNSTVFKANDQCCSIDEECILSPGKQSSSYVCYRKNRPESCNPNPCKNGGDCVNMNYYGEPVYYCYCARGFGGAFCDQTL